MLRCVGRAAVTAATGAFTRQATRAAIVTGSNPIGLIEPRVAAPAARHYGWIPSKSSTITVGLAAPVNAMKSKKRANGNR